ncbi:MAG TPA: SMI1/KNR4 family protein [Polyangiaceae bacterium]|nr:SMI1/KNR4 family protein [Polyangiaceae bacterium]
MMTRWQPLLAEIQRVQSEIMWVAPHRDIGLEPHPAASLTAIAAAEARIGRSLPPSYREFLLAHDGWPRFFEGASLLGTANLGRRLYDDLVHAAFEAAETPVPDVGPVTLRPNPRRILIPFGVDLQATTLFAFNPTVVDADGEFEVIAWVNEIGIRRDSFESFLELLVDLCAAERDTRIAGEPTHVKS